MFKTSRILALWLIVVAPTSATQITDTVFVGDKEWAQVNLFTNNSWDAMNTQCPSGICSVGSALNGWDLSGWTWASVTDVGALFNALTPHPGGIFAFGEANSTWGPSFFDVAGFAPSAVSDGTNTAPSRLALGWSATQSDTDFAYSPILVDNLMPPEFNFQDQADTSLIGIRSQTSEDYGGWFYRPVPLPPTAILLTFGLAGLVRTIQRKTTA